MCSDELFIIFAPGFRKSKFCCFSHFPSFAVSLCIIYEPFFQAKLVIMTGDAVEVADDALAKQVEDMKITGQGDGAKMEKRTGKGTPRKVRLSVFTVFYHKIVGSLLRGASEGVGGETEGQEGSREGLQGYRQMVLRLGTLWIHLSQHRRTR